MFRELAVVKSMGIGNRTEGRTNDKLLWHIERKCLGTRWQYSENYWKIGGKTVKIIGKLCQKVKQWEKKVLENWWRKSESESEKKVKQWKKKPWKIGGETVAGFRVLAARSVDSADGRLNNPLENILSLIKVQADHPLDDDDDGQILAFFQFFFCF